MSNKTVLITGVGGVGVFAAHLVAALPGVDLYLGDIRENFIKHKACCIKDNAMWSNPEKPYPNVTPVVMDLMDLESTTAQLREIKPDVVIHLASLLAAGKIRTSVPLEIAKTIYDANPVGTGLRPWAPGHAVLLVNLMKSLHAAGLEETKVINGSGCDFLHVALKSRGLAPTCGLGDFALGEPALKRIIARKYGVEQSDVRIHLAGHHSLIMPLMFVGTNQNIPYYIDVAVLGRNVTEELDFENDIFPQMIDENTWPAEAGLADQEQTAAHGVAIARAILFDTNEVMNVPAPQGLPGCYPARVSASGVEVIVPEGTTLEEMVKVNEAGNVAEGFKEIREDGTMIATDLTVEIIERTFGIEWKYKAFTPDNALEAFKEINVAFNRFVENYHANNPA